MVKRKSHEKKPKVFFHSRYDGATLEGTHLQHAQDALTDLFELSDIDSADFSISLDYAPENLAILRAKNISPQNRFLVVREPKQVHPYPHSKKAARDFGTRHYLGTYDLVDGMARVWPYTREFSASAHDFAIRTRLTREEKIIAIASWRVSFIRGALYSLRAKSFAKLNVDTFGRGWDANPWQKLKEVLAQVLMAAGNEFGLTEDFAAQIILKPANYKGSLESKFETLQKYKATLIIENSIDYMSEKVLDAFASATIPIYCGTDLEKFGVPSDLYISCSPTLEGVAEATDRVLNIDYPSWRERLLDWLNSQSGADLFDEKLQWHLLFRDIRDAMIESGKVAND